jgi:DMSO reductase anchor subunit
MRPAWSVLLLTTLIGAAQGLLMTLVGVEIATTASPPEGLHSFLIAGCLLALLLSGLGLLASFFHLGHPERAWRAMAGWRTSWLSREVLALPAFMAAVLAYGVAHWLGGLPTLALGLLACVMAVLLFVCTGMVYAAVKVIREWAHPITVLNYLLLGSASGATLAAALAAWSVPALAATLALVALALTLLALLGRTAAMLRNARLQPTTTLQSAIGVRHPRIVQKSQGAIGGSFNTREFFHGAAAATVQQLQSGYLLLTFVVPAVLLLAGQASASGLLLGAAFVVQYLGLLAERWCFFAQARHPQNLYYQSVA